MSHPIERVFDEECGRCGVSAPTALFLISPPDCTLQLCVLCLAEAIDEVMQWKIKTQVIMALSLAGEGSMIRAERRAARKASAAKNRESGSSSTSPPAKDG